MIFRHATTDDERALESFDLGNARSPWLDEVAEIVSGLIAWRDDVEHHPLDRQVVIAETEGEVVAVAAHERVKHERLGPLAEHCYLMVVAVSADHRQSGIARVLTESVFAKMQRERVRTVGWLVHRANLASIAFSQVVFAVADETYPPEDRPYLGNPMVFDGSLDELPAMLKIEEAARAAHRPLARVPVGNPLSRQRRNRQTGVG